MTDNCHSSLWDEDRKSLHKLLKRVDPALADMYRAAVHLLSESPHCWEDKARLSLVGHSLRELMNRLPDSLKDVDGFPASNRGEEDKSRESLVAAYNSFRGKPIDQPASAQHKGFEQPALVTVPRDLLDAVGRFVAARAEGSRIARERDSAAVLGKVGVHSPALAPWGRARKFFMRCTHLDLHDGVKGDLLSRDVVMGHVDSVEAALRVRLGPFFDSYAEIKDIVSRANELDDEETGET